MKVRTCLYWYIIDFCSFITQLTHTQCMCVCVYIYMWLTKKEVIIEDTHGFSSLSLSSYFFFFFVNRWGYLDIFKYLTILFGICSLPNFKPKILWISWDFKNLEHSHQLFYKKCHLDILKAYFIILTHHFTIHHLSHLLFFDSKH